MTRYAITGAFGFSGRHIAANLVAGGQEVLTLTNHPGRADPSGGRISVAPLSFHDPDALVQALEGVDVLFNTYWIRFAHRGVTHSDAVRNSLVLIEAARGARVRRIVHVSIANPDASSRLAYYRGKAQVESALVASGLSHAILRPAVLFGDEPILINTVAWLLRRVPVFGVPGNGRYGIQPIHVGDLADLALRAAAVEDDLVWDAAGPEAYAFTDFVRAIRDAIGSRAKVIHLPERLALLAAQGLGLVLRDTLLTAEELDGLTANLLVSHEPPRGTTRFSTWLDRSTSWLGRRYLPEIARHFDKAI